MSDRNSSKGISLFHLNIRSLRNKTENLSSFAYEHDIVALTETWLNDTIQNDQISLYGFQEPIRNDRQNGQGGGVCVYFKNNLHFIRRKDLELPQLECIWTEVIIKNGTKILLGIFYRPPCNDRQFWVDFEESLDCAKDTNIKDIFIMGDFNDDQLNSVNTKFGLITESRNMAQLISEPTRVTGNSATCIDVIATSCPDRVDIAGVIDTEISDHFATFCHANFQIHKSTEYEREVWLYDQADFDGLNVYLNNMQWEDLLINLDVNDMVSKWTELFLASARKFTPTKVIKVRPGEPQWLTTYIKRLIRKRNRLYKKAKKNNNPVHWEKYRRIRNNVVSNLRKSKQKYYSSLAEKVNSSDHNNSKLWWKIVKQFLQDQKALSSEFPPIKEGDNLATGDADKAELFNDFFAKQCSLHTENAEPPEISYPIRSTLTNIIIDENLVKDCISLLKVPKASGPDNISPKLLKACSGSICKPLLLIFNKSLESATFPTDWKSANVNPLHKKESKQFTENYRPISLLSCVSKIFERCVFKFIFNHCIDNKIITRFQSAYQEGDSPVSQLLEIYDIVLEAIDKGKTVKFAFLDVSRAFDRVWHKGLLHKLDSIGIRENLLSWFKSYLENRRQRVVINGQCSSWHDITAGVPQGSILGPLLFLIYINDIASIVESNIRLFADDTSLFVIADNEEQELASLTLNGDLSAISIWADQWFISLNERKTFSMTCSRSHNLKQIPIFLKNTRVSESKVHKHLGVILSSDCTWTSHLDNVYVKAMKRVDCLRGLKFILSRRSLEKMYLVFIRPLLEYGDIVWDNCSIACSDKLEKVQLAAARVVTGGVKTTSNRLLYKETQWEMLQDRREKHKLTHFFKIVNGMTPGYLRDRIPEVIATGHNTRHSQEIPLIFCQSEKRRKSFFPSTIQSWRNLDEETRNSESIRTFKTRLNRNIQPIPSYYLRKNRFAEIQHTRMRLNCSPLNDVMFQYGYVDSPKCACGAPVESIFHFLTECRLYNVLRTEILGPFQPEINGNKSILLYGDAARPTDWNMNLFNSVEKYILRTNRFNTVINRPCPIPFSFPR